MSVEPAQFGSAHFCTDGMTEAAARALLDAAVAAGAARLDTAPLYGHGCSEALVAEVARRHRRVAVTTKVGLAPSPPPSALRRAASSALGILPGEWLAALRRRVRPPADRSLPSGRFAVDATRASIERSLALFGAVDRLLLHEVHAADVSESLLELLAGYRQRGDIAAIGVATDNGSTAAAVARSHGLFTVAHVSVDPLGAPVPVLPATVHVVGHGALGAGARTLARWRAAIAADAEPAARWAAAVRGSAFDRADGDALALLARAASIPVAAGRAGLLVATRRIDRVAPLIRVASGHEPLPPAAAALLDDWIARRRAVADRPRPTVRTAP